MKVLLSERLDEHIKVEGLKELEAELERETSDLKVNIMNLQVEVDGWVSLEYEGEDSEIFTETLRRRYGFAPAQTSSLRLGDAYKGFIRDSGKTVENICIDVGIIYPKRKYCFYPASRLRAQLADGSPEPVKRIREMFCLHEWLPIKIRMEGIERSGRICVALTDRQEETLKRWRRTPPDRIIVIGAVTSRISEAIREANLEWDIINVVRLSLTASILECKLGRSVENIVSKLRPRLPKSMLKTLISTRDLEPETGSL
ncbi:MAG: DUF2110 family protein [Candidatus Bathyarchaeia archaeon]